MGNKIFKSILIFLSIVLSFSAPSLADEPSFSLIYIDSAGKDGSAFFSVDWEKGIILTAGPTYCENDRPIAECIKWMLYTHKIGEDGNISLISEEENKRPFGASEAGMDNIYYFLADYGDWQFHTMDKFDLSKALELHAQYREAHYSRKSRLLVVEKKTGKILDELQLGEGHFDDVIKSPKQEDGSYYLLIAGTSCGASACGGGTTLYRFMENK